MSQAPEMGAVSQAPEAGRPAWQGNLVFPGSGVRRFVTPALWVKAWWAALTLVVPVVGLVVGQAVLLPRHFRVSPTLTLVDLTVVPSGGAPIPDSPVIEMAAFGDSAMAGVGVHRLEDVLAVQLAQRVADATGRRVHVAGYAQSGARTSDVLSDQLPRVVGTPDVSVLVVGANDVMTVTAPHAVARSSKALLDALESLGAPVVMSGLPRFTAMRLLPHPLMEAVSFYGGVIGAVHRRAAVGRPSVRIVDVGAAVGPEYFTDATTLSDDAFHPSAAGYARIADALVPAVLSALSREARE